MNYLLWVVFFIPNLLIKVACTLLSPLVAIFFTHDADGREQLVKPLYWFQTHDNPVDEYWWGGYYKDSLFKYVKSATQNKYDTDPRLRYLCRVLWLCRNCGYGFSYNLLGRDLIGDQTERERGNEDAGLWWRFTERSNSWQLKAHIPLWKIQLDINIGWKTHKGFPRAMYADRLISFRYNPA